MSFPGVKSGRGVTLTPHPLLVPWSRKSRATPLLPLWAVRPVQSLSACTRVHFTFTFFTLTVLVEATETCRLLITYVKVCYQCAFAGSLQKCKFWCNLHMAPYTL